MSRADPVRDLTFLPTWAQDSAIRTRGGREVMWPSEQAAAVIDALATAGRVILGLDLRSDGPITRNGPLGNKATEIPWGSFEPSSPEAAVDDGRRAATEAMQDARLAEFEADGYSWVLITWADPPRLSGAR